MASRRGEAPVGARVHARACVGDPARPRRARVHPRGSRPSAESRHPHAVVQHQALRRGEPPGQHRHAHPVVDPQPATHVRAAARGRDHAEPLAEDLGLGHPVRDEVVEEHDALGQRHRAGRPGDDDLRQVRLDGEQVQHARQLADVPTGDDDRLRLRRIRRDLLAVPGDHRPLLRPPRGVERRAGRHGPGPGAARRPGATTSSASSRAASRQRGRPSLPCATS